MRKSDRSFAVNRKARFNYDVFEKYEAGLVLLGTEIKAVREGKSNLSEAFARPEGGELWLMNAHIAQYSAGGVENHEVISKGPSSESRAWFGQRAKVF